MKICIFLRNRDTITTSDNDWISDYLKYKIKANIKLIQFSILSTILPPYNIENYLTEMHHTVLTILQDLIMIPIYQKNLNIGFTKEPLTIEL